MIYNKHGLIKWHEQQLGNTAILPGAMAENNKGYDIDLNQPDNSKYKLNIDLPFFILAGTFLLLFSLFIITLQSLFPVFCRGHAFIFFKQPLKIGSIWDTTHGRDVFNVLRCGKQKQFGPFDSFAVYVFNRTQPHYTKKYL